jgi:hypothetical protein
LCFNQTDDSATTMTTLTAMFEGGDGGGADVRDPQSSRESDAGARTDLWQQTLQVSCWMDAVSPM